MGLFDFFKKPEAAAVSAGKVKDPVCGMMIYPSKAEGEDKRMGQTFYFCSINCQQTFRRNPLNYMSGKASSATPGKA